MRLAAIDIGSNAARLLISDVIRGIQDRPEFVKTALVQVPLRLGFDVFDKGEISATKVEKILKTIKSYKLLLDVYEVKHLKKRKMALFRRRSFYCIFYYLCQHFVKCKDAKKKLRCQR